MKNVIEVRGFNPHIGPRTFVAPNAFVIGDVVIGEDSSIWYNVTIRGDVMPIRIGRSVNIQDGSVLHGTYGQFGCELADRVTVGHQVTLHGCKIGFESLIGMGSTVMDGAEIGARVLLGAGSLVTPGTKIPDGMLAHGRPAKAVRPLRAEEIESLRQSADNYLLYKTWYDSEGK